MNHENTTECSYNKVVPLFSDDRGGETVGVDDTAAEQYRWLSDINKYLVILATLKPDWDTYGTRPIAQDTLLFAAQVLSDLWVPNLSRPFISPMSSEGVMLEWETDGREFIVSIEGPYKIQYFFDDQNNGVSTEGELSELDFSKLKEFARKFTNQSIDYRRSA